MDDAGGTDADGTGGSTGSTAAAMAAAARSWIDGLRAEQLPTATAAGPGEQDDARDAERRRWFYTPTDHGGLTLHAQSPAQQRRAMVLLATGLSEAAYTTVATVMGLEDVLDRTEGFTAAFGRERGRDPRQYHLRVFGDPSGGAPWGWRFGGHHVSVNVLVVDGRVAGCTPLFLGADPAASPLLGGAVLRPLGAVEDLARELVRSLPRELAGAALLSAHAPTDVVGGNRSRVVEGDRALPLPQVWRAPYPPPAAWAALERGSAAAEAATGLDAEGHAALALSAAPKGVPAAALDAGQRELLRALLGCYLDRAPAGVSPMPRYAPGPAGDAALDAVHLAWAGGTAPGEPHYYRLQGPRLLVEWDNTQRQVNHAHSVWRDPEADFGLDALAAHRARHHRG